MILKGEIYTNNRFLSKVKAYQEDSFDGFSIVPKNRNHFLYFYPDEHITFHHLDEKGVLHMYHIEFQRIHMIRTKIYYQFTIHSCMSHEQMKNALYQPFPIRSIVTDFHTHYPVDVCQVAENQIETVGFTPLKDSVCELFYYTGKKKTSYLLEHPHETEIGTTLWNVQQKWVR